MSLTNIVIFASGSGTNAENLINYFSDSPEINVSKVLSNKEDAYVHQRAKNLNIPSESFSRSEFTDESFLGKIENADFLILAGFLWLIPPYLIQAFPNRIINIHPALLPKFGGKGMYGSRVHEAVIENGEKESGITIHLVNEEYDEGEVLFRAKCSLDEDETPDSLAKKIHKLEYEHFPIQIEQLRFKRAEKFPPFDEFMEKLSGKWQLYKINEKGNERKANNTFFIIEDGYYSIIESEEVTEQGKALVDTRHHKITFENMDISWNVRFVWDDLRLENKEMALTYRLRRSN